MQPLVCRRYKNLCANTLEKICKFKEDVNLQAMCLKVQTFQSLLGGWQNSSRFSLAGQLLKIAQQTTQSGLANPNSVPAFAP
jgi:hypothetical protein